jgi:hypothetical protein
MFKITLLKAAVAKGKIEALFKPVAGVSPRAAQAGL